MSKIKLGELRINNWYESVKWKQAVMCEMSDIVQIYYIADGAKPDEDHIAMVFKPIPLTEDWLRRFGFELRRGWYILKYSTDWEVNVIEYSLESNRCALHEFDPDWSDCAYTYNIKYVHQLQNLYFALTGEELTLKD